MIKRVIVLSTVIVFLHVGPVYSEQVHRVSPHETLSSIASQYGVSVDSLIGNNQYIVNPNLIFPGQVLIIPDQNRQFYVVRPGDTLSEISQRFGVPISILVNVNELANADRIYVGQVLLVPKLYTVEVGDSLETIAIKLSVDVADLLIENNLSTTSPIQVGQTLVIPFRPQNREEPSAIDKALAPFVNEFPDTFFYKGQPGGLRVAITFDDGPGCPETNEMLDVLREHNVPGTFFLLGRNIPGNSDVVQRIVSEGHIVANHTTNHIDLRTLTDSQICAEMLTTENEIFEITCLRTALMRPPYGFVNSDVIEQLREMCYKIIKWSVDSNDWRDMDVDAVLINTIPNIRDGSIILMHDNLKGSVAKEVLPEIIHSLRSQGYSFVTVDELLGVDAYK